MGTTVNGNRSRPTVDSNRKDSPQHPPSLSEPPTRIVSSAIIPPGTILSNTYEIIRLLGSGGFSDVYLAHHIVINTRHAIKVIQPVWFSDKKVFENFCQEARVIQNIKNDSVVRYDGFFQDDEGRCYLVMEFVDGPSLGQVLEKGPLSVERVYRLRDRLVDGLMPAHDRHIVHRDISPGNVILPEGRVEEAKLIDFGICKLSQPDKKPAVDKEFAGKYRYASPEQIGLFSAEVDVRSDVYSLGLLMAAAAIGKPLDAGDTPQSVMKNRQKVPDLSAVPAELQDQLVAMLQPTADKRPQNLRELLRRWPTPGKIGPVPVPVPPPPPKPNWLKSNKLIVSGFLLLFLAAGLFFLAKNFIIEPQPEPLPIPAPPTPTPEATPPVSTPTPPTSITTPTDVKQISPENTRPLLMQGKQTLYQRILTRPGARFFRSPDGAVESEVVTPLSVFYVYARVEQNGRQWIEAGPDDKRPTRGWLEGEKTIDWRQTLTLAFTKTGNREPALFFQNGQALARLIESIHLEKDVSRIRERIAQNDIPEDFPVIAIEPDTYIDPNENFYLLPILGLKDIAVNSGPWKLFNVAAVTLHDKEESSISRGTAGSALAEGYQFLKDYRVGVVFVIDTTTSMGPYIERTRSAVQRIYRELKNSSWGRNISFGLVGFRDNVDAVPGLEYVTRIFASLEDGLDETSFLRGMDQIAPTDVSSQGFNEDAYAGIYDAITKFNWKGYGGRFIVLITDAGARSANDPLGRTGYGAERLRTLAQEMDQEGGKVAIAVMHLLTPEGRNYHSRAANQYQELSQWGDVGSLYFPVKGGSVFAFDHQVNEFVDLILRQVENADQGNLAQVPTAEGASELARQTAVVGQAMQLAYIGRVKNTEAPTLIEAWVTQSAFENPSQNAVEMRVLITKNQLSDLYQTLQRIKDKAEMTMDNPVNFFTELRSAAALMTRDPNNVVRVERLVDMSRQAEWLEDLPGTSPIMNISERQWLAFGPNRQQQVIDVIDEKIRLYEEIYDNTDRWVRLHENQPEGDTVTTVPIDILP